MKLTSEIQNEKKKKKILHDLKGSMISVLDF